MAQTPTARKGHALARYAHAIYRGARYGTRAVNNAFCLEDLKEQQALVLVRQKFKIVSRSLRALRNTNLNVTYAYPFMSKVYEMSLYFCNVAVCIQSSACNPASSAVFMPIPVF